MPLYGAAAEYALHTVLNIALAAGDDAAVEAAPSARDLAEFQRLPVPYMRKLLTRLEKSGLLAAAEGVRGGWRLARPLAEISVLAVAEAAQGRESLFACRDIRTRCALWPDDAPPPTASAGVCAIHAAMLSAEAAMRRELAGRSLADIAAEVRRKSRAGSRLPAWFATRIAARRAGETEDSDD